MLAGFDVLTYKMARCARIADMFLNSKMTQQLRSPHKGIDLEFCTPILFNQTLDLLSIDSNKTSRWSQSLIGRMQARSWEVPWQGRHVPLAKTWKRCRFDTIDTLSVRVGALISLFGLYSVEVAIIWGRILTRLVDITALERAEEISEVWDRIACYRPYWLHRLVLHRKCGAIVRYGSITEVFR